jgi:hypothetical protein
MNKYTEIITQNNELNKILIICPDLIRHFEQIFPCLSLFTLVNTLSTIYHFR